MEIDFSASEIRRFPTSHDGDSGIGSRTTSEMQVNPADIKLTSL